MEADGVGVPAVSVPSSLSEAAPPAPDALDDFGTMTQPDVEPTAGGVETLEAGEQSITTDDPEEMVKAKPEPAMDLENLFGGSEQEDVHRWLAEEVEGDQMYYDPGSDETPAEIPKEASIRRFSTVEMRHHERTVFEQSVPQLGLGLPQAAMGTGHLCPNLWWGRHPGFPVRRCLATDSCCDAVHCQERRGGSSHFDRPTDETGGEWRPCICKACQSPH